MEITLPDLNDRQIEKLSDISAELGIVSIGSVAIPAIIGKSDIFTEIVGLFLAILFWMFSLWLRR